ncbi:hypothetical protein DPMN_084202 [Dreissena polymorpha]|uniref:Uncharacterized protein n=1 Tax=Dreissena polymorpha TaxID=45954 RepID=A0A9D4BBT9_DREPO|nr:hypothetical protein DPMN_084202 [Dreissena polymorpha]
MSISEKQALLPQQQEMVGHGDCKSSCKFAQAHRHCRIDFCRTSGDWSNKKTFCTEQTRKRGAPLSRQKSGVRGSIKQEQDKEVEIGTK